MSALKQGIASPLRLFTKTSPLMPLVIRNFHASSCLCRLQLLSRVRCVDNSAIGKQAMAEGKPPKIIHVYNKKRRATIGDKVLMTVKGEMKKGIIVGVKEHQKHGIPRSDTNNVVLIDDNGTPLGTRINAPIPMILRGIMKEKTIAKGADYTKILSIASRFV
ncbi:39S ribosomal protein L14, mitochondrial [Orchesella cincta]|uniref:Large ribosomal subunit protein uL14m n=1 Tax=Orchesella cincta TaxID=48709 RepID=A0A1D2N0V1_ORCCI|nr:39S ribosomal protein L14, mitochondrial [Orchesella cincta]